MKKSAVVITALRKFSLTAIIAAAVVLSNPIPSYGSETTPVSNIENSIDKIPCFWLSAKDFGQTLPHFKIILETVEKLHPYFESVFEREAQRLRVCRTTAQSPNLSTAGAFDARMDGKIFIHPELFSKLDPTAQAYFLFEKVSSSFISYGVPSRENDLRNFVASVQHFETNGGTPEQFFLQLTQNHMSVTDPTLAIQSRVTRDRFERLNNRDAKSVFIDGLEKAKLRVLQARGVISSADDAYAARHPEYIVPIQQNWDSDPLISDSAAILARKRILNFFDVEGTTPYNDLLSNHAFSQVRADLLLLMKKGKLDAMIDNMSWQDVWLFTFAFQFCVKRLEH